MVKGGFKKRLKMILDGLLKQFSEISSIFKKIIFLNIFLNNFFKNIF